MKSALIISTYNWPEALKLVLKSFRNQSVYPDEVIIADDGSGKETREVIEDFRRTIKLKVNHIWQEDRGFRKSAILNKALAQVTAEYVIQIDGDCIMHKDFIKDHLARAEPGVFLFGSRVNIKPGAVEKVLNLNKAEFSFFSPGIKNKTRNIRIPVFQDLYKPKSDFSEKTRGCNLSYWREDFIAVNGYDETMEGWGREDSEFVIRLLNKNIKGKRLRYGGIVYHIYHPEKSKEFLKANSKIQQRTIKENKQWCENGVAKYLAQNSMNKPIE
ncbi:MAG TPA: glycosyltransferase family 2 protein [Salegentibacter sp.]|uniref:glycosyltransferase family 2 protein n=1 Tax=Salegentibacter sp. TaxID=1903072 RepID=UPI002F93DC89